MTKTLDLQNILDALFSQDRQKEFSESDQLSLGELILKLEIQNQEDKLFLDFYNFDSSFLNYPVSVGSWRGRYAELAIEFECYNPENALTVGEFLADLKEAVGGVFQGYKGGEYKMGRSTPVWVANYGESSVSHYNGLQYANVYPVEIRKLSRGIVNIVTKSEESEVDE